LELLRLVHAGLSNQQIADSTGVALPTVKWHLYNVYAKLDVKNRSAAIARARSLSLIF
jgi:LuxR family maltose regulon positive regulatory protein